MLASKHCGRASKEAKPVNEMVLNEAVHVMGTVNIV